MLSGPDAFPFFRFSIAFLISCLVGFSVLIGRAVSAAGMSRGSSGGGRFNGLEKCSVHLLSCSWAMAKGFPCLFLTGLSVCWYLPANFLTLYSPLRFLYSFFYLSCQVVNVASLICSYTSLHLSVRFIVFFLAAAFVVRVLLSFRAASRPLALMFCEVAGVIHSLCRAVFQLTTSLLALVHICWACSHVALRARMHHKVVRHYFQSCQ